MKCVCIGICQMKSICYLLKTSPNFSKKYTEIQVYAVYEITPEEMQRALEEDVSTCDLIISQPISDNYRNTHLFSTKTLKTYAEKYNIPHITMVNSYFTGYDPLPFQPRDPNGNALATDYCFPIASVQTSEYEEFLQKWNDPDLFTVEQLEYNVNRSLKSLEEREAKIFENDYGIDIRISDYIRDNYKHRHLFLTMNHPSNLLMLEVTRRIFERLGIEFDVPAPQKELLGMKCLPPAPAVYQKLGMTFQYPDFVINHRNYNLVDAYNKYKTWLDTRQSEDRERWIREIEELKNKIFV